MFDSCIGKHLLSPILLECLLEVCVPTDVNTSNENIRHGFLASQLYQYCLSLSSVLQFVQLYYCGWRNNLSKSLLSACTVGTEVF